MCAPCPSVRGDLKSAATSIAILVALNPDGLFEIVKGKALVLLEHVV